MVGEDAPDLLAELLPLFFEDAGLLLDSLQEAVVDENAEAIQQAAHTLKGSSANLGMTRLSSLCLELETIGRKGDLAGANDKFAGVVREYERIKEATMARQAAAPLINRC